MKSQRGNTLLVVCIISVLAGIIVLVTTGAMRSQAKTAGDRRETASVLNIAEAGKEHALQILRTGADTMMHSHRKTLISETSFAGGAYTVACSANADGSRGWIWSTGTLSEKSKTIAVEVSLTNSTFDLSWIKGAVTTKCSVEVTGNACVDGRDWDSTGNDDPGSGTYAVWSCKDVDLDGSSSTAGNGNDPPKNKGEGTNSVLRNQDCTDYPQTPEEALGLEEGALDSYKKTPSEFGDMGFPFHGIVYVTGDVPAKDVGESRGILIVHNDDSDAKLHINGGDFKGIIIADVLDKANGNVDIRGAVLLLGNSSGDKNKKKTANGNADIKYSGDVVNNIEDYIQNLTKTVDVLSWKEM